MRLTRPPALDWFAISQIDENLDAFYESTDPVAFARSIDKLCTLEDVTAILPGHNDLGLTRSYLEAAQAAFHHIERQGALHHGSGLHEFGRISIRL